jgi:phosphoribosylformimino-5-aminoimidazole carboxamide ribonucleotide (ProFAR) isomerase
MDALNLLYELRIQVGGGVREGRKKLAEILTVGVT